MNPNLKIIVALFIALVTIVRAEAADLSFTSVEEARSVLMAKDAFVFRMSPFDRAARMKTDREISEAQYLEFAASAALAWEQQEKDKVVAAFKKIKPMVERLALPLPDAIYFVKTSGREEGGAAYTRGNAIILPKSILASPEREIQRILAHELFHISSRFHPKLATTLYETIGFHYCGELDMPPALALRKITNPDAPKNDFCISLGLGKEKILGIPILLSRSQKYDVSRGGEFFQYLQLAFILVERNRNYISPRVISDARGPRLVGLRDVSGFFEQVGQNTDYIIHPEEILADNFALLVLGSRDVRSPEVLRRIQAAIAKVSEAERVVPVDAPKASRP